MNQYDRAAEALRERFRRQEEAIHSAGYLTIADAAQALGVDRHTVNRMIGDGRLRATRVDDRTVTRPEWIAEVPRSRKTASAWRRENGFLSVAEAAELAGITRQALQVRITRGQQPAVRAGDGTPVPGAWLIRKSDVVHHAA
ncbi:helix-turn-helix domain-containing protein [Mycolicibacterium sp.]|uniref:helix-turn-helix domain-containing protein n=1 Tax=Mycolicibacterium sp. TaxID=2320850 RepID=UPI0037C7DCE0